jgi:hypothetical protein
MREEFKVLKAGLCSESDPLSEMYLRMIVYLAIYDSG